MHAGGGTLRAIGARIRHEQDVAARVVRAIADHPTAGGFEHELLVAVREVDAIETVDARVRVLARRHRNHDTAADRHEAEYAQRRLRVFGCAPYVLDLEP